jgi:hypothetical protein
MKTCEITRAGSRIGWMPVCRSKGTNINEAIDKTLFKEKNKKFVRAIGGERWRILKKLN